MTQEPAPLVRGARRGGGAAPASHPESPDRLWIVAEVDGEVAGSLIAYLQHPVPSARFALRQRGAVVSTTGTHLGSPLSVPFWTERQGYRRRSVVLNEPLR